MAWGERERERGTAADNGKAVENPISIENKSKRKTTKKKKKRRKEQKEKESKSKMTKSKEGDTSLLGNATN